MTINSYLDIEISCILSGENKEMNNPLVSVIIPVFNTKEFLPRCLDSVCSQTYENLEIIVVDNNSIDSSRRIALEYAEKDDRIVIYTEQKQGQGAARDKGLDKSKGEWVCFVDSDDFIHPKFVEMLLYTALKYHCLTVQCRYKEIYSHGMHFDKNEELETKILEWHDYLLYLFRNHQKGYAPFGVTTNIHHRSLFKDCHFDGLQYGEDSYLAPRLLLAASAQPVGVINQSLYYYYIREGSILHSKPSIRMLDHWYAKECAANFWKKHGEQELYDYYYTIYFNTLVIDYLRFCVYLSNEKEQYEILRQKIEENQEEAKRRCEEILLIHPGAALTWKQLQELKPKCIQYGYGSYGKLVYPFLRDCGFDIEEIWDVSADGKQQVDGIPIRKPHHVDNKEFIMLITVKDELSNIEIRLRMKDYGIRECVPCRILGQALRYGVYQKYLSFLLE